MIKSSDIQASGGTDHNLPGDIHRSTAQTDTAGKVVGASGWNVADGRMIFPGNQGRNHTVKGSVAAAADDEIIADISAQGLINRFIDILSHI